MMKWLTLFTSFLFIFGCQNSNSQKITMVNSEISSSTAKANDTITLGAGCFWCVEAAFMQLKGVVSAKSGYSGGTIKNPSYKEVCNGTTGHAEVVQIVFDSTIIDVPTILEAFFTVHDPTQMNRQGNDIGTQYRSAIFYHNDAQKSIAEKAVRAAQESGEWPAPIVTEITQFSVFYPAEDYHDNYYNLNKDQPYCSMVITPKMNKFKKKFHQLIQE
jgi:peptide-methionine (S)-S-oxide reductase